MITEKKISLKPILESANGIHLTIYLANKGDVKDLKFQLNSAIGEAYECLFNAQTSEERKKFLEPLDALLRDQRIFKGMKGNLGLFRTKDSFRVLNIPIDLESQCHVASSFHVKPLLRWLQLDREFLMLGITDNLVRLFSGNHTSAEQIGYLEFSEIFKKSDSLSNLTQLSKSKKNKLISSYIATWVNEILEPLTQKSLPRLYLSGEKSLVTEVVKNLKYKNLIKTPILTSFHEESLRQVFNLIRSLHKMEAKKSLEQALMEFRFAEEMNLTKKNIFQIAKAATQGKVKKLIVADGINIFGKFDKKSGNISLHPFDLDHEDDDILDDLAQAVLASGGDVHVAPREEIPKGRPILAIMENAELELEKKIEINNHDSVRLRNLE